MTRTLIGHDSPTGRYPSPVVPVCEDGDRLLVFFRSGSEVVHEEVSAAAEFVRHAPDLRDRLRFFHADTSGLFAFSERDVISYSISAEKDFFEYLLQDARFERGDPFLRLAFAMDVGHSDLVGIEIVRATAAMQESAAEFLPRWYAQILERLAACGFLPGEWPLDGAQALMRAWLPRSARSIFAGLRPLETRVGEAIRRLRETVRISRGNGLGSQLDEVLTSLAARQTHVAIVGSNALDVAAALIDARDFDALVRQRSQDVIEFVYSENVELSEKDGVSTFGVPSPFCALGFRVLCATGFDEGLPPHLLAASDVVVVLARDAGGALATRRALAPQATDRFILAYEAEDEIDESVNAIGAIRMRRGGATRFGRSWFERVASGIAALEDAIGRVALQERQRPALRAATRRAQEIGLAHDRELEIRRRDRLHALERSRLAGDEIGGHLTDAWLRDLDLVANRCKERVTGIVDRWRLDLGSSWLFSASDRETLQRSVSNLHDECASMLRDEIQRFAKGAMYDRDQHPNVVEALQRHESMRYADPFIVEMPSFPPSHAIDSISHEVMMAATFTALPWFDGAIFPRLLGVLVGGVKSFYPNRARVAMEIKFGLLEGISAFPGYRRLIDEWAGATARAITRSFRDLRVRWLDQVAEMGGNERYELEAKESVRACLEELSAISDVLRE